MNYLEVGEKIGHWKLGANLARSLFGQKGYDLCAGHTKESGLPVSKLYIPDKACSLYVSKWFMNMYYRTERFYNFGSSPQIWLNLVRENQKNNFEIDSHDLYLNNRKLWEKNRANTSRSRRNEKN